MSDLRKELIELSESFKDSDIEYILSIIKYGDDEQIESLVYECNAKLEGRSNDVL